MEKENENRMHRIVLIGAESTGKSDLTTYISEKFNIPGIAEYARTYIEALQRNYSEQDVWNIAEYQMQEEEKMQSSVEIYVADTDVLITQIWLEVKYRKESPNITNWLKKQSQHSLYLLCEPDIPWQYDPVRENGGENRIKLHNMYKNRLINYNLPFYSVSGIGTIRFQNACEIIRKNYNFDAH